jgi:hypothetical protein
MTCDKERPCVQSHVTKVMIREALCPIPTFDMLFFQIHLASFQIHLASRL